MPKGVNCPVLPTRSLTSSTSLYLHLPCGNVYTITVRAVTNNGSSAAKQTFISIPSQIGAVRNLAVKFIPGNNATRNNATGLIKQREGGFLLTWEPPAHVKAADVKVGNKLQPNWLFNTLPVWKKKARRWRFMAGVCMVSSFFLWKIILLIAFLLPCL